MKLPLSSPLALPAIAAAGALTIGIPGAKAAEVFWDVPGPASFTDGANWAGGVAPGAFDTAVIANDGTATVESGAVDVDILDVRNGTLSQSGGTITPFFFLNIGSGLDANGIYTATGGALEGGSLRVGEAGGQGSLSLANASYLSFEAQTAFFGDGVGSTGSLTLGEDATFTANVSGGEGNGVVFGRAGGNATLTMTDNASLLTQGSGAARHLYLGQAVGATGGEVVANLSGTARMEAGLRLIVADGDGGGAVTGTLNLSGESEAVSNDYFVIGRNGGTGFVTVSESAKLIQQATQHLLVGDHAASTGTLTVKDQGSVTSFGDLRVGASGDGTMNIEGNASVTPGRSFIVGYNAGSNGKLFIKDNALINITDNFAVGLNEGATGSVEMTGGTMNILSPTHRFLMANSKNSQATMTMSDGTITVQNEVWIGNGENGVATLTMSGNASVTANAGLFITFGRGDFSTGTLNISGNARLEHLDGSIRLGEFANAVGTINASGNAEIVSASNIEIGENGTGTVLVQDNALLSAAGAIGVGNGGGGRGTLTVTGGTVTANGAFTIANGGASTGTVNLDGGTIEAPQISRGGGDTAKLNLNGGTLRATADSADFLSLGFLPEEIEVKAGGARIDTGNFNVVINNDLAGAGGLTKLGTGTLVLTGTNTFSGFSAVQAGTLEVDFGAQLADVPNLHIAAGAELLVHETVSLNSEIVLTLVDDSTLTLDFEGTATVAALWINGEAITPDEYTLAELNDLAGNAFFEGNNAAILDVTSTVPEPGTVALLGAGLGIALWRLRRRRA